MLTNKQKEILNIFKVLYLKSQGATNEFTLRDEERDMFQQIENAFNLSNTINEFEEYPSCTFSGLNYNNKMYAVMPLKEWSKFGYIEDVLRTGRKTEKGEFSEPYTAKSATDCINKLGLIEDYYDEVLPVKVSDEQKLIINDIIRVLKGKVHSSDITDELYEKPTLAEAFIDKYKEKYEMAKRIDDSVEEASRRTKQAVRNSKLI